MASSHTRRLQSLANQLCEATDVADSPAQGGLGSVVKQGGATEGAVILPVEPIASMAAMTVDPIGERVAELLPGPLQDPKWAGKKFELMQMIQRRRAEGTDHHMWMEMQEQYCKLGLKGNIVLPTISRSRYREPIVNNTVILAHPEDCERIARAHVMKQPNFTAVFADSVISTIDNDHWKKQREYLVSE
jgi:hypothetical protein